MKRRFRRNGEAVNVIGRGEELFEVTGYAFNGHYDKVGGYVETTTYSLKSLKSGETIERTDYYIIPVRVEPNAPYVHISVNGVLDAHNDYKLLYQMFGDDSYMTTAHTIKKMMKYVNHKQAN